MFSRKISPGTVIVRQGKNFESVGFVLKGQIETSSVNDVAFFLLERGSIYGDYQTILGSKSRYELRTPTVPDFDKSSEA